MSDFVSVALNVPVKTTFTYRTLPGTECAVGQRVEVPFRSRKKIGFVTAVSTEEPTGDFEILSIARVVDEAPLFGKELLELAEWISSFYFCSIGEALQSMVPSGIRESPSADPIGVTTDERLDLSDEQLAAVTGLLRQPSGISYVRGVTGSGKTEVFLRVAEETLQRGRGVIYLVPEISLTYQLIEQLVGRFGERVGVIHSRLTRSQRLAEWQRIASGEATFVVGARSAIFSPVRRLGLCVVDEEHEGSYKSGSIPRYHARQVAMKRAASAGARLIMGSATPSSEAIHQIKTGRMNGFTLSRRLSGGAMPAIKIVDMKRESGALSKHLKDRVLSVHAEGRQTILFLNRRGFSYFFHCRSCGYELLCRSCSVALTFHKSVGRLVCHYCGYSQYPVEICPECDSVDVGYSGFGTEFVEETVAETFPELRVERVDADRVRKRGELERLLSEFRDGNIDLLLGTQMVAKGLNFPGVKLVGIINADTGLNIPDFRAEERVFGLIVQVSGRAGRFVPDGEVVIQTARPESPAIQFGSRADIDGFYERELEVRRELGFPPFGRLIRIVFRGKLATKVTRAADEWTEFLRREASAEVTVLGPADCAISVMSGNHRMQVILRSESASRLHRLVESSTAALDRIPGVHLEIDVDPVSLM